MRREMPTFQRHTMSMNNDSHRKLYACDDSAHVRWHTSVVILRYIMFRVVRALHFVCFDGWDEMGS